MEKLEELRQQLDEIDLQIVKLLNKRMKVTDQIAKWKIEHQTPVTDHVRETQVIAQAKNLVEHPVLLDFIEKIFNMIMECAKASRVLQQNTSLSIQKIGIIGLGLMGGSIAKALKTKNSSIHLKTLAADFPDNRQALNTHLIDGEYSTLHELIKNSELIILATPISTIIPIAKEISKAAVDLQKKLLVMDVASVKGEIVKQFETLSGPFVEYISTHPMAGSEHSGLNHSSATLFVNAPWIISSHEKNSEDGLIQVRNLIEFLGGVPFFLDAATHDKKTALISHLPSRISLNILNFVKQMDPTSLEIAGPGFKSMTRLAHSNPILRAEIASANRENIDGYLNEWMKYIQKGKNP